MRQTLREIWTDNKNMPGLFLGKLIIITVIICIGIFFRELPYSIYFFLILYGIKPISLIFAPEVDYMIPRSIEEFRKEKISKCVFEGSTYSGILTIAYIFLVSIMPKYSWDFNKIILIFIVFILSFLYMFKTSLLLEMARYGIDQDIDDEDMKKKENWNAVMFGIDYIVGIIYLLVMVIIEFGKVSSMAFLREKNWRIIEIIIFLIISVYSFYQIRGSLKKLKPGEYRDIETDDL